MNWSTARLDEVTRIVGGATPSTTKPEFWGGDVLWATPADLSELTTRYISDTPRKLTAAGLRNCAAEELPAGSVLFSSRAPIGHLAINLKPMSTNQGFKSFVPDRTRLDADFLYWWLDFKREYLKNLGNGATFKEVSKAVVSRVEIPLPPLDEQRRIASILNRGDDLRQKRHLALESLGRLIGAVFFDMFGDPSINSDRWQVCTLGDISSKITDGEHLNPTFSENGMPIVMAGHVLDDAIDLDSCRRVSIELGRRFRRKCDPRQGDLLLVSRGATIGRITVVQESTEFCLMGSVILIKPDPDRVDPLFLTYLLKHPAMHARLYATSGSSAQQAIYLKDVRPLRCILPPLNAQRDFANKIRGINSLRRTQRDQLSLIENLIASVQHDAFEDGASSTTSESTFSLIQRNELASA